MAQRNKKSENSKSDTKKSDMRIDIGDILRGFATSSSGVVQKAASILEEEIAAGIIAAKQVEEQLVDINKIRSQKPDALIQRFRRDSHEVVDVLLDLLDVAVKKTGGLAQRLITIRGTTEPKSDEQSGQERLPTIEFPGSVKPGESGSADMTFENSEDRSTGSFNVLSTDLLSSSGSHIPASRVQFTPSTVNLKPKAQKKITVTVRVPKQTPPGVYSGLIQATGIDHLRATLVIRVA